jgi:phosphoenolpyruvate carboxykinase (GTP)
MSAFIFGGRRNKVIPLVYQAFNWNYGVYLAATMGSETTAAAVGAVGTVRRDPFAMLPFCGYHVGDYFAHWLQMGRTTSKPPRIFSVNWFRKDANGKFLWPGYGENSRVLAWVFDRCAHAAAARDTAIGRLPVPEALPTDGLTLAAGALDELLSVDENEWRTELPLIEEHYAVFGDRLPTALHDELDALAKRLAE